MQIDLVQIAANPQQNSARTNGGQVIFAHAVIGLEKVLHAIGLRQQLPMIKGIHVNFSGTGLITAYEMARQPDARYRQMQTPAEKQINEAQTDRTSRTAV